MFTLRPILMLAFSPVRSPLLLPFPCPSPLILTLTHFSLFFRLFSLDFIVVRTVCCLAVRSVKVYILIFYMFNDLLYIVIYSHSILFILSSSNIAIISSADSRHLIDIAELPDFQYSFLASSYPSFP